VLRRGKTFTPDDILHEYPIERVGDVSYDRSMKGNKLIIGFKDGSSATLPVDEPKVEIFKVKFDTRPVR
jgi:hypothetical protein